MALESTQPLTEMNTRDISLRGKGCTVAGLVTLMCRIFGNSGSFMLLELKGPLQAYIGITLRLFFLKDKT
jgi:hypothetical protein